VTFDDQSSKNYPAGNRGYWWYTLSNPDNWMKQDTKINLILYDESNTTRIGTIILPPSASATPD
jgi:hypothetical protein